MVRTSKEWGKNSDNVEAKTGKKKRKKNIKVKIRVTVKNLNQKQKNLNLQNQKQNKWKKKDKYYAKWSLFLAKIMANNTLNSLQSISNLENKVLLKNGYKKSQIEWVKSIKSYHDLLVNSI